MSFQKYVEKKYEVFAMANLSPSTTGIEGAVLWVSVGECEGKKSVHNSRIKVVEGTSMSASKLNDAAIVSIEDEPKLLHGKLKQKIQQNVYSFIKLNKDILLDYWNGKIDTYVFVTQIKSVK